MKLMILCILAMVNAVLTSGSESAAPRRRGPAPLLDGTRRSDWTTRPALARRIGAALADRGEIAYCIGGCEGLLAGGRRARVRDTARMRLAKLLDEGRRLETLIRTFAVHGASPGFVPQAKPQP